MKPNTVILVIYEDEKAKAWFSPVVEHLKEQMKVLEIFDCKAFEGNGLVIHVKSNLELEP
jgi:hypothetical protein